MGKNAVEWQRTRELTRRRKSRGDKEGSAYWEHYYTGEFGKEDKLANPDEVENLATPWPARHTEEELDVLKELDGFDFRAILNEGEANILSLVVFQNKSLEEIKNILGYSRQRIHQTLVVIRKKIRRYLDLHE